MPEAEANWSQQIDKISYGVAGFVGLVVLCMPFVFSGSMNTNDLEVASDELNKTVKAIPDRLKPHPPVDLKDIVATQWTAGSSATQDPAWRTEIDPVVIKLTESKEGEKCIHEPGAITAIEVDRDPAAKRAHLVVKGRPSPKNEAVVIERMELLRREDGGEPRPVPDFKATGEFEHKDSTVVPGRTYSYKLVTHAAKDPKAPAHFSFVDVEKRQESAELGPTPPVPHEFSLTFNNPQFEGLEAQFYGSRFTFLDYKQGKAVTVYGKIYKEGETSPDGRFEFFQVEPEKVTVREKGTGAKHPVAINAPPRPVDLWSPVVLAPPAPPEGAEPAVEPPAKGKDGKEKKPTKPAASAKGKVEPKGEKKVEKKPEKDKKAEKGGAKKKPKGFG